MSCSAYPIVSQDPIELVDHSIIKWNSMIFVKIFWIWFTRFSLSRLGLAQACILEVEGDANRGTQTEELEPGCYVKVLDGSLTLTFLLFDVWIDSMILWCLWDIVISFWGWATFMVVMSSNLPCSWMGMQSLAKPVCEESRGKPAGLPHKTIEVHQIPATRKISNPWLDERKVFVRSCKAKDVLFKGYRPCRQPLTFCLVYIYPGSPKAIHSMDDFLMVFDLQGVVVQIQNSNRKNCLSSPLECVKKQPKIRTGAEPIQAPEKKCSNHFGASM